MTLFFIFFVFFAVRPLIAKQLLNRGSSYMTYELYDDAIRTYRKAIWFDKNNSRAWEMLGFCYGSKGDLENALRVYQDAIKINPKNISALFGVGATLMDERRVLEAVPYLERVRALGSDASGVTAKNVAMYYESSLRLLLICYEAPKEFDKKKGVQEELRRFKP